jgi:hypothetical protein
MASFDRMRGRTSEMRRASNSAAETDGSLETRRTNMLNDRGQHILNAADHIAVIMANQTAAEPPAPVPETPADAVKRLEAELATLRSQLDAINAATKRGDVQAARTCDLQGLTIQVASLENELTAARKSVEDADWQASRELQEQRRQQFPQAVEQALRARADARRAYREMAVALGVYCAATKQAIQLNHEIRAGFPAPDPDRLNALRDIENRAALDPLNELLDAGYTPLMDFGHDLKITVPPLTAPEKRKD